MKTKKKKNSEQLTKYSGYGVGSNSTADRNLPCKCMADPDMILGPNPCQE